MSESYASMATVYDRWMDHDAVPYPEWWDFIAQEFRRAGVSSGRLLDLGCGTGRLSVLATTMGFDLVGVDASADMLDAARTRMPASSVLIESRMQDLDFEAIGPVDAVMCCFDALNYVTDRSELRRVFQGVAAVLRIGGPWVFDLRSRFTLEHNFAKNSTGDIVDDFAYVWRNDFDAATGLLRADVSFFLPSSDGRFERFDEVHFERAYQREEVMLLLEGTGFQLEGQYDRYRDQPLTPETDRETWVVRRRR